MAQASDYTNSNLIRGKLIKFEGGFMTIYSIQDTDLKSKYINYHNY